MSTLPLFKIRSDHFHVLQGSVYVLIDRARVDSVHFHAGVLSVRYRTRGEVSLDCAAAKKDDLLRLLNALQAQRDQNHAKHKRTRKNDASSIIPGLSG